MLLALGSGIFLIFKGGLVILYIVIASLSVFSVTVPGHIPLHPTALARCLCLFFSDLWPLGTYYLAAGSVTPAVFVASVPVGLMVTAIIVVNNLRDIETDARRAKEPWLSS